MFQYQCFDKTHVWLIDFSDLDLSLQFVSGINLSEVELERYQRFQNLKDAQMFSLRRKTLRKLLAEVLGMSPGHLNIVRNALGMPTLPEYPSVFFSSSYSANYMMVAVGVHPIGIDVEHVREDIDVQSISSRFYSENERAYLKKSECVYRAFFSIWTAKEAYLKAVGCGLSQLEETDIIPLGFGLTDKTEWSFHQFNWSREIVAHLACRRMKQGPILQMVVSPV